MMKIAHHSEIEMPRNSEEQNIVMLAKAMKLYAEFLELLLEAKRKNPTKDYAPQLNRIEQVFELTDYINRLHSQTLFWKHQFMMSQTELAKHEQALIDTVDELNKLKQMNGWQ